MQTWFVSLFGLLSFSFILSQKEDGDMDPKFLMEDGCYYKWQSIDGWMSFLPIKNYEKKNVIFMFML